LASAVSPGSRAASGMEQATEKREMQERRNAQMHDGQRGFLIAIVRSAHA
jgi:hypothetical protein